jgi:hypothetical protein
VALKEKGRSRERPRLARQQFPPASSRLGRRRFLYLGSRFLSFVVRFAPLALLILVVLLAHKNLHQCCNCFAA